jgi:hypothetical protein
MADMLRDEVSRQFDERRQSVLAEFKSKAQEELDSKMDKKSLPLPVHLASRELSENEIEVLKKACLTGLLSSKDWDGKATLGVIDEFVQFCTLLSKPENHIKERTKQYVEKQVSARSYKDMADEMSQVLVGLERFSAYAKVIQEQQGEQIVLKQKIKTLPPPPVRGGDAADTYLQTVRGVVWEKTLKAGLIKERSKIEEEIRQRQQKWLGVGSDEPPPPHS